MTVCNRVHNLYLSNIGIIKCYLSLELYLGGTIACPFVGNGHYFTAFQGTSNKKQHLRLGPVAEEGGEATKAR